MILVVIVDYPKNKINFQMKSRNDTLVVIWNGFLRNKYTNPSSDKVFKVQCISPRLSGIVLIDRK